MAAKPQPQTLVSDRAESPSIRYAKNAEHFPDTFLNFLKTEWSKDRIVLEKNQPVMAELKAIKVQCTDGVRRPIAKTYLPTTRLVFIHKRYAMGTEKFPFLYLPQPLPSSSLGSWAFLDAHFDVKITDDLHFYLEVLSCIKRRNTLHVAEYPRRILELYLRIHSVCKASRDPTTSRAQVREAFEKENLLLLSVTWGSPASVVLNKPTSSMPRYHLLPPPKSWEAMEGEVQDLREFYTDTLCVYYFSWVTILDDLLNRRFEMSFERLHSSYSALDKMVPQLSKEAVSKIKQYFARFSYICLIDNEGLKHWYKTGDCIWSGGMQVPNKVDLSQYYPDLESFFTRFLNIQEYKGGFIYKNLITPRSKTPRVEDVKELLWSLNEQIEECGQFLDPRKFLSSKVLPIRKTDDFGSTIVGLCSGDAEGFIADLPFLENSFAGRVGMLDFTPHEVWRLQPLLIWAGLEPRYLSWNVEEVTFLRDGSPKSIDNLFTPMRALGLARIASHFRSPRASSVLEEQALAQILTKAELFQTDGIYSCLNLNNGDSPITLDEHPADIHIEEEDGGLEIYLPNGPDAVEFCSLTKLPRKLGEWMMTDPTTKIIGRVDEVAVSIVKSVLNAKDSLTSRVLDSEGIFETSPSPFDESSRPTTPTSTEDETQAEVDNKTEVQTVAPSTPKREGREAENTWLDTPTPKNNEIGRKLGSLSISDEQASIGSPKEIRASSPSPTA